MERTGLSAGTSRLRRLLAGPAPTDAASPLEGITAAGRTILACLRGRLDGATAARIADDCGLSSTHTRRSLRQLQAQGFADCYDTNMMWGYRHRRLRLWRLSVNDKTVAALAVIGWRQPSHPPNDGTVPPEFWYLFWSGQDASELTISDHALHIADTLVGSFDRSARSWALNRLPVDALRALRAMRGYSEGRLAHLIDTAISRRNSE